MWWWVAGACVPAPDGLVVAASLGLPPDPTVVAAARELAITTAEPTTLTVTLDDGVAPRTLRFPEPATTRTVPLLGFTPGAVSRVTARVQTDTGESETCAWDADIPPLPDRFPLVEVLALEAAAVEPGWTLFDVKVPQDDVQYLVMLDEAGAPIWWWTAEVEFGDVRALANGHLLALGGGEAWELDLLGRVVRRWGGPDAPGEGPLVPLPVSTLNHEISPTDEGFTSLAWSTVDVPAFPVDEATPDVMAPATLADPHLVAFAWDGTPQMDVALSAILDPRRIGYGSLNEVDGGYDWAHTNGVIPDPEGGGLLVNVRHQDVLFALTPAGDLDWMLGTPSGWQAPWAAHLLTPVGDPFRWPSHAHAPEVTPDGTIVLFDNAFPGYTPYDPPVEQPPARAVGYRVDRAARTVSEVFSFSDTTTGPLQSDALGDADVQPLTGNVLADFGFVPGEGGLTNEELGYGARSVRLVEWSPAGEVVADVRLRSDLATEPAGWKTYRVERLVPGPMSGAGRMELGEGE